MEHRLVEDVQHVLSHTADVWEALRKSRIFITGGTGFIGCWLLESFAWANDSRGLEATALVLTRDPAAFQKKAPHLASHPAIQLYAGDVRSFQFPEGKYSHIIHAATEASAKRLEEHPLEMLDTIVQGTRHTLEFAKQCQAKRFLLMSSGAVYGRQPTDITHLAETDRGAPHTMDPRSAYGEGKRQAELLCALAHRASGLETVIARCFAFVGPYLPLDAHFAIGNFIRDGLCGGPIHVHGDGTPHRSYLYAADLAIWLWHMLVRGEPCRPYNVGSDVAVSIAQVARVVAECCEPTVDVWIAQQPCEGRSPERYVPSVERVASELQLRQTVPLDESVRKTLRWHLQERLSTSSVR